MYRRTSKYQAQRRLGPIGGRTPRDPEDEPKPLPELRMRITVERFDFHDERHVFELKRTRRVDVFDVLVGGQPDGQRWGGPGDGRRGAGAPVGANDQALRALCGASAG